MQIIKKARKVIDGWLNTITGSGVQGHDKTASSKYGVNGTRLSYNELSDMYDCEGLAASIVDTYVKDMIREGYTQKNDKDEYLKKKHEELKVFYHSKEMLTWNYLFGGGVVIPIFDENTDNTSIEPLREPLDLSQINDIVELRVYDRYEITVSEYNTDKNSINKGKPEIYKVSANDGAQFEIHHSRVYRSQGMPTSNRQRRKNDGWGASIIDKIYEQLKKVGMSFTNVEQIIDDFIISVLKIEGLADILNAPEQEGEVNPLKSRLEMIDLTKHIINTVLMGENEDFKKLSSNVGGLDKLLDKFFLYLSAVSKQPMTVLFGQSPGGLNATGESDLTLWYDTVAYEQVVKYQPFLMWLNNLIMLSSAAPFGSTPDKSVKIEFNSLWQPTEKEQSETEKNRSETAKNYAEIGALVGGEIRNELKKRDVYPLEDKFNLPDEVGLNGNLE